MIGALASNADTLMRLIYQKYQSNSKDLQEKGVIPKERDVRTEHDEVTSLRVRIEMELGLAGVVPVLALVSNAMGYLDVLIIYMALYYGGACIVTTVLYTLKTLKYWNTSMDI